MTPVGTIAFTNNSSGTVQIIADTSGYFLGGAATAPGAMNITIANSTSSGVITAYAGGSRKPGTSNLNYTAGQIIPNFAITAVGPDGTISFTNDSPGTVQLIADTTGYYNAPVTGGQPGPHTSSSQ